MTQTNLLAGKKVLIFGVANKHSIAWGIAQAMHEQGAELAFSYAVPQLEKRVRPLAESLGATFIEECDVTDDAAIDRVFDKYAADHGHLDIMIHSIAYAERDDLDGRFVDSSREGFKTALEISVFSLVALSQRAEKLMPDGGAIMAMTAYGGVAVIPGYNVMGVAKAALESSVRYLAYDLGPKGIRVNAISAGPIKTLASSGIGGFKASYRLHEKIAPLRSMVTQREVGDTAVWLCSDWARSVTGEITYVDSGWNILGATLDLDGESDE